MESVCILKKLPIAVKKLPIEVKKLPIAVNKLPIAVNKLSIEVKKLPIAVKKWAFGFNQRVFLEREKIPAFAGMTGVVMFFLTSGRLP
ncbi:MAG TPA: hypothetical protein VGB95_04495 [Chitinophagales bacterium]